MIAIDMQTVGTWAEKRGIAYTSFMDLSRKGRGGDADRRGDRQGQCHAPDMQQAKRYLLLNKELEADDAEMTRTRKVRRKFVAEKYANVIDAFYGLGNSAEVTRGNHLRGWSQVDRHPSSPSTTWYRPRRCVPGGGGRQCPEDLGFLFALLLNGVSIGLMYSLIALGFVLVYKATDAINFAQGEFVMLAGLIVAMMLSFEGMPLAVAVIVTLAVMIAFGFGLERVVLRPLLGRPSSP